jgi:L-threonylcarbamoyladenylate synthase
MSRTILDIDEKNIEAVVSALKSGELAAIPTETVYGLAADCEQDDAVTSIFARKERPEFNPLIVHVNSLKMAERYGHFSEQARKLTVSFWPGALTLVLKRTPHCSASLLVSAGLDTIAIRTPAHPVMQSVIGGLGKGVAAPSANKSGRVSPTKAEHVLSEFKEDSPLVLDGGSCVVGVESTIIDMSSDMTTLLRPGSVTKEMLEQVMGEIAVSDEQSNTPKSPGMLASHYAPSIPVRLNALAANEGEVLLAFGPTDKPYHNLSTEGDVNEAAANLFAMLRALDQPENYTAIAVMPIPERGVGMAINDRLRRAAKR